MFKTDEDRNMLPPLNLLPLLIVGSLEDFEPKVQALIQEYAYTLVSDAPQTNPSKKYSVTIFSPDFSKNDYYQVPGRDFFYLSFSSKVKGDIQIVPPFSYQQFESSLNAAIDYHLARRHLRQIKKQHLIVSKERENLNAIGIALSAEKDLNKLLGLVLKEGRTLAKCEGASLYLIEKSITGEQQLVFKLTQNSKISFDFKEVRFPLTSHSLAGHVALTGEILNIQDVYQLNNELGDKLPFQFDKSFDQKAHYRSKELLVLPMKNHKGKVIGILQFVNTFGHQPVLESVLEPALETELVAAQNDENVKPPLMKKHKLGFSKEKQRLLEGLASQAAVAIDNSHLIENIQNLFEGFVSASVNAIESRDPVTSGHSFRVAELTTGLAEMLHKETSGKYKNLFFNQEQLKEIRYASLLHDFGKVGVKENVLLKANKLHASRYQYLMLKIEWQKQVLEKKYLQQLLRQSKQQANLDLTKFDFKQQNFIAANAQKEGVKSDSAYRALLAELNTLEQYKDLLFQANKPHLMQQDITAELSHMADYTMHPSYPFSAKLIDDADFLSLSILQGSLTDKERLDIQAHVVHTQEFLERIPWTDELSSIPKIAGGHHEKLDGSGYPYGLRAEEIPLASKIMTIADIFDALTAQDRPYKKAVSLEHCLDILSQEANRGKLDQDILQTFVSSQVYRRVL